MTLNEADELIERYGGGGDLRPDANIRLLSSGLSAAEWHARLASGSGLREFDALVSVGGGGAAPLSSDFGNAP